MNPLFPIAVLSAIIYPLWNLLWWFLPVYKGWRKGLKRIDISKLKTEDLPTISIFLPVYKEGGVLKQLLGALNKLNYPSQKLDIKMLLERDDDETINAIGVMNDGQNYRIQYDSKGLPKLIDCQTRKVSIVYVEDGPRTKPNALNSGLKKATGEIVGIYDAEDMPEPDQLEKVAFYFATKPNIACVQAKLNFYNQNQSLITKFFAIEYSGWFDLFMAGWHGLGWVIPLGGTSNFVRRSVLQKIGGWDPYCVTEDADLGIRLARKGYETAVIDSTTWEEAVPYLRPWIRQRTRWMKGFLQCLIKHCKNPIKLIKETNLKKAASIYLIGLQPIITMLFLPMLLFTSIYWLNWIGFPLWGPLTTFASLVHGAFSNPLIFHLSLGCFVLGNITWLLCNLPGIIRRGFFNLIKYVYLIFIYWCLQSLGAWRGLIELIIHPHHWHKTPHGYHLKRTPP